MVTKNNIKKVAFVGDIHFSDITPRSRKDDYFESLLLKIEEILFYVEKSKIDAIVLLGDIFDRMEPSGKCRNTLLRAFNGSLYNKKWNFLIYVVEGNHDNKNAPQNLTNSALGTLIHSNILRYTDNIQEFGIGIVNYYVGIEDDFKNGVYSNKENMILAVHANISDTSLIFEHVKYNDITLHPNVKIVVSGHLHKDFSVKNDNGVIFINPGSICRREISDYNLSKKIKFCVLEYSLDGTIINLEDVFLNNIKSSNEIFKIEESNNKKQQIEDTRKYIQKINSISSFSIQGDIIQSIKNSAKTKNISSEVLEIVLSKINEVRENKKYNDL